MRTSPTERVVQALVGGFLVLQLVRWFRLRGRGSVGPPGGQIVEYKKASCTGANYSYETACTDSWFEHWWGGIQYCDDAQATCELHGGVFKIVG
jgi:hypothetical protein